MDKGAPKPLALPRQGPPPLRPPAVGRVYVMSKKKAATSGAVVTRALFLNSKPIYVLFDLDAMQLSPKLLQTCPHHHWGTHFLEALI